MKKAFIVYGKRTPIGSFMGGLSSFSATQLSSHTIKTILNETKLNTKSINSVILGNVISSGLGQNPARQASLGAGIDISVPCTNINKVCSSGMKSTMYGALEIFGGMSDVVITGGFESMSNAPHLLKNSRLGNRFGDFPVLDTLTHDGLIDAYGKMAMGFLGEKTAKELSITRQIQDEFCIASYERAILAQKSDKFKWEIAAVESGKNPPIANDEEPLKFSKERVPTSKLAFTDKNKEGTITGANASKINDGACSLLLMSEEGLKKSGLSPLAEIISFADAELQPSDFNLCPPIATQKALERVGMKVGDVDFWEANEAFSVTAIAFMKTLGIDHQRLNVHGGAVALGHPIGMSGARIILSLVNVLKSNQGKYGCAAICNGGGGSSAIVIKNIN